MRITIFGGTGFLGSRLVPRLPLAGHRVRVAARHASGRFVIGARTGIETATADIADPSSVMQALANADLAINLVGAVSLPDEHAYFDLHERGAHNVAEAAGAAGVARLVHVSALGIADDAPSAADRSKAAGERAVRAAFPAACLVRPSLVYGEQDHFFSRIDELSRVSPAIHLVGASTRVQPLHVDDFAEGLVRLVVRPDTDGSTFEFAGPCVYTLRRVVELLLRSRQRRRLLLSLPYSAARALAAIAGLLPSPPLSRHEVDLLRTDKIATAAARGLADLGVTPRVLEDWLAGE